MSTAFQNFYPERASDQSTAWSDVRLPEKVSHPGKVERILNKVLSKIEVSPTGNRFFVRSKTGERLILPEEVGAIRQEIKDPIIGKARVAEIMEGINSIKDESGHSRIDFLIVNSELMRCKNGEPAVRLKQSFASLYEMAGRASVDYWKSQPDTINALLTRFENEFKLHTHSLFHQTDLGSYEWIKRMSYFLR